MTRQNQIVIDFKRLLNDGRLAVANVMHTGDVVTFVVVSPTPIKSKLSDGSPAGHMTMIFPVLASVTLEKDYSNIFAELRAVMMVLAFPARAPLIRLRVSTLSGKRHCTLGVTDRSNLEFYGVHNRRVSDQLADAILNDTEHLSLAASYSDAFISHAKYSNEAHYTFKVERSQ